MQKNVMTAVGILTALFAAVVPNAWAQEDAQKKPERMARPGFVGKVTSSSVTNLVLGQVFIPETRQLRPILGTPGSSVLSDDLDLAVKVGLVEVSPSQEVALAVLSDSGQLVQVGLAGAVSEPVPIPNSAPGPDRIVFSPTGASALAYSSQTRRLQLVTGMPLKPVIARDADLSTLPGSLSAMAVSDDGKAVLVATSDSDADGLYLIDEKAGPRAVHHRGGIADVGFFLGSHDAVMASRSENRVILIRDVTGTASLQIIADENNGVSKPAAVAASKDGLRVYTANTGSRSVLTISIADGSSAATPCSCRPSRLQRLHGDDVFLLTAAGDKQLALVEGGPVRSRVVFVRNATLHVPVAATQTSGASEGRQ